MKNYEPDENGDLEELFGLAGIPPADRDRADEVVAEWIPNGAHQLEPPKEERVSITRRNYNEYIRELHRLNVQWKERLQPWQVFIWGFVLGMLLAPILADWLIR